MVLGEVLQTTLRVTRTPEELGVDYLVGGSLASSLHGIPRATHDADLVADMKQDIVETFGAKPPAVLSGSRLGRSNRLVRARTS